MKRFWIFAFLVCLGLLLSGFRDETSFAGGTGTKQDPYQISTPEQLRLLSWLIGSEQTWEDYNAAHYRLTADVDLRGRGWTPIGTYEIPFAGNFDGGGYTVRGLKLTAGAVYNRNVRDLGFFGCLSGTVKDLTIADSAFTASGEDGCHSGTFAGQLRGGTVENCHAADTVTVSGNYASGGITGYAAGGSVLRHCTSAASVTDSSDVGSAAGITPIAFCPLENCTNSGPIAARRGDAAGIAVSATADVDSCTNSGSVTAEDYAGGILCRFSDGALNERMKDASVTLSRCENSGSVTSRSDPAGGIAASCRTGQVVDCRNSGSVTSPWEAGGILGYFQPSSFGVPCQRFTVADCENSGEIASADNYAAGGICGMIYGEKTALVLKDCRNTGLVRAYGPENTLGSGAEAGGILGWAQIHDLTVADCRNEGFIIGHGFAGGIAGRITPGTEEAAFRFVRCENTGDVFVTDPGGLHQSRYAGGILGWCPGEDSESVFARTEMKNCNNTGVLSAEPEGIGFWCGDLCAAWNP